MSAFRHKVANPSPAQVLSAFPSCQSAVSLSYNVITTPGSTVVIIGVVTDGWLKGHAVEGEYTVIMCDHNGTVLTPTTCFEGTLEIDRDSND